MKIVVGLGNPGPKYETTRHNAGFLIVDLIAEDMGTSWTNSKFGALVGKGLYQGEEVLLVKPQTFMNLSGQSVARVSQFYKVDPHEIVVLHDDIDLDFGKIKARVGGGHGGHNGIRSIIGELGSSDFHRIKLGVGRPAAENKMNVASWVLDSFTDQELLSLQESMLDAVNTRLIGILKN